MPAYSFKERFIPMLKDGSKTQTIRKNGRITVGQTVYLYYGMRTKYCTKIGEGICTKVDSISILESGEIYINSNMIEYSKDILAWRDGFRPEYSTEENCNGAFNLMLRWWMQTHELPFHGEIIYWKKMRLKIREK